VTRGPFIFSSIVTALHRHRQPQSFAFVVSVITDSPSIDFFCGVVAKMAVAVPTSISGYVSLLAEPEPELQSQALQHLNQWVDQFWMEIADSATLVYFIHLISW